MKRGAKVDKTQIPLKTTLKGGVPEVSTQEIYRCLHLVDRKEIRLIDVRRPDEFTGELGHIESAELKPLGEDFSQFLKTADRSQTTVFICRSGARSAAATLECLQHGFKSVFNMTGGMLKWNADQFEVVKSSL